MSHRLFVAINFPQNIKDIFKNIISDLAKWNLPIRTVKENNLHLTIKFLDSRTSLEKEIIRQKLWSVVLKEKRFNLFFSSLKVFPSKTTAKVISVSLRSSQRLTDLERKINRVLNKFSFFTPEKRRFKPHITLARIENPLSSPQIKKIEAIPLGINFKVNAIELMESDLSSKNPLHTIIEHYPLTYEN